MRGQFIGISRQNILSHLTPRDLLLGETADENEVSTILGKCRILRRNPGPLEKQGGHDGNAASGDPAKRAREGAFYCNFDILIEPATKGNKSKVIIKPYDGPDEEEDLPPAKKARADSYQDSDTETVDTASIVATESVSMDEAPSLNIKSDEEMMGNSHDDVDDESSLEEGVKEPSGNKPPTTEGSTTLKIMVGEKHQAVIPLLVPGKKMAASTRAVPPTLVWKPDAISGELLDKFVQDAGEVLKAYMKENDIEITRNVSSKLDPKHLPSNFTCREFNMDQILKLLHDKSYKTDLALHAIKASPKSYLFIWTKEDKELYNAGFKRHFSAIRFISKGMGPTKTNKDVVDYHYRFKIPDQFRRYQDKKREQARRMLDCVEKHRLDEYLSPESAQSVNNAGNGSKKIQNW